MLPLTHALAPHAPFETQLERLLEAQPVDALAPQPLVPRAPLRRRRRHRPLPVPPVARLVPPLAHTSSATEVSWQRAQSIAVNTQPASWSFSLCSAGLVPWALVDGLQVELVGVVVGVGAVGAGQGRGKAGGTPRTTAPL